MILQENVSHPCRQLHVKDLVADLRGPDEPDWEHLLHVQGVFGQQLHDGDSERDVHHPPRPPNRFCWG